jgi:hypothetical protein
MGVPATLLEFLLRKNFKNGLYFCREAAYLNNSMELTPLPAVAAALRLPPLLGKMMTRKQKDKHPATHH